MELLDEVDDDDAPADIPSFEDLLEKEAGRSNSVVRYETKSKLPQVWAEQLIFQSLPSEASFERIRGLM